MPDEPQLYSRLRALKAKTKEPNSATALTETMPSGWIAAIDRAGA